MPGAVTGRCYPCAGKPALLHIPLPAHSIHIGFAGPPILLPCSRHMANAVSVIAPSYSLSVRASLPSATTLKCCCNFAASLTGLACQES